MRYLRCLFFVRVAERRPEEATPALEKAIVEAQTAADMEINLWNAMKAQVPHEH